MPQNDIFYTCPLLILDCMVENHHPSVSEFSFSLEAVVHQFTDRVVSFLLSPKKEQIAHRSS